MPVSVHVRAVEPRRPDLEAGVARVYAHLRKVDAVLSTWRADSDLLRLQHRELDEPHAWVADVTELCLEAEERTDGLFRAWRRRPGGRLAYDPTGLVKGWAVATAAAHLDVIDHVATSGAAARGGHVVDPRTGVGVTRPGSATVVGPDLLWADVWATAAWVDPERAEALMRRRDPAYRLLVL